MNRAQLARARRVVIKVGTSLLAPPDGEVQGRRFTGLARNIALLVQQGRQVILVSSGAVGLGTRILELKRRPREIPIKQAAAAVGQIDLCRRFERAFAAQGLHIGQILLTHSGLADREGFLNARHTLRTLLELKAVPLINENDSVATEELRFSDNDHLSALVTNAAAADLLILLTDTNGLHDRPPAQPGAQRIGHVARVTPQVLALTTGGETSRVGTGGMRSKLEAARMAARFGTATVIADGRKPSVLQSIFAGRDVGTLVSPDEAQISARKHWIAYSLKPRGLLYLDGGAVRAVCERGRSLLPIGVTGVEGRFGVGDPVRCLTQAGDEIARGLSSYSAEAVERIKGQRSRDIAELLGYSNGEELIHRNDLVLV